MFRTNLLQVLSQIIALRNSDVLLQNPVKTCILGLVECNECTSLQHFECSVFSRKSRAPNFSDVSIPGYTSSFWCHSLSVMDFGWIFSFPQLVLRLCSGILRFRWLLTAFHDGSGGNGTGERPDRLRLLWLADFQGRELSEEEPLVLWEKNCWGRGPSLVAGLN